MFEFFNTWIKFHFHKCMNIFLKIKAYNEHADMYSSAMVITENTKV